MEAFATSSEKAVDCETRETLSFCWRFESYATKKRKMHTRMDMNDDESVWQVAIKKMTRPRGLFIFVSESVWHVHVGTACSIILADYCLLTRLYADNAMVLSA